MHHNGDIVYILCCSGLSCYERNQHKKPENLPHNFYCHIHSCQKGEHLSRGPHMRNVIQPWPAVRCVRNGRYFMLCLICCPRAGVVRVSTYITFPILIYTYIYAYLCLPALMYTYLHLAILTYA